MGASLSSTAAMRSRFRCPLLREPAIRGRLSLSPGGFVKQVGEPAFTLDSAMPGASGHQIFHFGIEASGTGALEIRYLRPWEKGSKPAKVFKIMLIVH